MKNQLPFLLFLSLQAALFSAASPTTAGKNQAVLEALPFGNTQDFEDAQRGFIAPLPSEGVIRDAKGNVVWDLKRYAFLKEQKAPDQVNPSLWRQAQLLYQAGLFKVTEGIYQVRGADISNMTILEGKKGIIIIDPLLSVETAKTALDLYYANRPKKPITAVIYTHSHADHFGGVRGIVSQEEVAKGKVKIFAPEGFTAAAVDEFVLGGNVMARRAAYMYGNLLTPGPDGQVTSGLGLTTSTGEVSLILPTDIITKTGEKKTIDGIDFVFLFAPGSEAPAEMLFYLPGFKALCAAEDATHTMHNLYTLRGAKIRDAKAWAHYLNQAIELFAEKSEVVFAQHHWPTWGTKRVVDFLEKQRDLYKYIHDQSLHLANQGYTMVEIAEKIQLPKSLSQEWYNRGYYGTLSHNAKSVYCFYLGWFDGNPSTLNPLPPVETGKKMVEYMGGSGAILAKAQKDYDLGNYRFVAQVLNHLVFAEPSNVKARQLLANTLEQLGYQAESGPWRNFYLTGAKELKDGVQKRSAPGVSADVLTAMSTESLFDYMAVQLDGPKAAEHPVSLFFEFPDTKEKYLLQVKNGVLNYFINSKSEADSTIRITRADLNQVILGRLKLKDAEASQQLKIEGDRAALMTFLSLLDRFDLWFNIVEPVNSPNP